MILRFLGNTIKLAIKLFAAWCLLVFSFVLLLIILGVAFGEDALVIEEDSFLRISLSTELVESPGEGDPFDILRERYEDGPGLTPLYQLRETIRAASEDDRIKGIYLFGGPDVLGSAGMPSELSLVREALLDFRQSGKKVVAYLDLPDTGTYYLATAADELYLHPYGQLTLKGFASQPFFLSGMFEKYGIGVQYSAAGDFKGAVEPFTRDSLSDPNRLQLQELLDSWWAGMARSIEETRGFEEGALDALANDDIWVEAEEALDKGFFDGLLSRTEVQDRLIELGTYDADAESYAGVDWLDYYELELTALPFDFGGSSEVAIVYAEGEIVPGSSSRGRMGSGTLVSRLQEVRENDDVKAVVFRVNSPGGSAWASDFIREELLRLREEKPVVVSMGSMATSGGYWISTSADRIIAEPMTITGSIGVFAVFFNVQELSANHGVTFDRVVTHPHADFFNLGRPFTEKEEGILEDFTSTVYDDFLDRVVEARGFERDYAKEIAQGRIYTGARALELNLVDELGTIEDAIEHAASLAKLGAGDYTVVEYPRHKMTEELIADLLEGVRALGVRLPAVEPSPLQRELENIQEQIEPLLLSPDPRGIYTRMPYSFEIK